MLSTTAVRAYALQHPWKLVTTTRKNVCNVNDEVQFRWAITSFAESASAIPRNFTKMLTLFTFIESEVSKSNRKQQRSCAVV